MDKRQGGFEAWQGTPRAGTRVPIVTPFPAVSPDLEDKRLQVARERAAVARARYEAQFGLPSSPLSASSGAGFDP